MNTTVTQIQRKGLMSTMEETNVKSFYQHTMKNRVEVTDELLDALAEEYFVRPVNFENMNYGQWVEYRVWQLSNA